MKTGLSLRASTGVGPAGGNVGLGCISVGVAAPGFRCVNPDDFVCRSGCGFSSNGSVERCGSRFPFLSIFSLF